MPTRNYCWLLGAAALTANASMFPLLAQAADTVKMGAPVALTGTFSDEGHKLLHGYEMCVDAVNAKGGLSVGGEKRKLEMVQYDYQSDTNTAVQLIQRMATVDNVDFLMSPYNSGATKTAAVAAERYDTPMIASAAATPSVFDQHFKNLYGILFPNAIISNAEVDFYKAAVPSSKDRCSSFAELAVSQSPRRLGEGQIRAIWTGSRL